MGDTTKFILGVIGIIIAVSGPVFAIVYPLERKGCLESYSNYHPQFGFWTNCRIEVNGVLTPVDIVRELN